MKTCLICQEMFEETESTCPVDKIALTRVEDENLVGKTLVERYEIQDVVGSGGMGLVYRARHLLMHRTVAIKVLTLKAQAETVKRFKAEAQAISVLSHPNILSVFDFGVAPNGQPYMVMDFLEGEGLDAILEREGRLAPERCIRIFEQICLGLAHAHAKGVIHRDVKPSNVMVVSFEGQPDFVKIVDFGIAKMLRPPTTESENLTRTGEIFGSPLYMSPEQCRGLKLDARADIYSFGAMLYRALSGSPIFDTSDVLQIMFHQVTEMPKPFSTVCPDHRLPAELEEIVFKCLAKDPEDRFQSMSEVGDALSKVSVRTEAGVNTLKMPEPEALKLRENTVVLSEQSHEWIDTGENTANLEPGYGVAVRAVTMPPTPSRQKNETTISIVLPKRVLVSAAVLLIPVIGIAVFALSQLIAPVAPEKEKIEAPAPQSSSVREKPVLPPKPKESISKPASLAKAPPKASVSQPAKKKTRTVARRPQAKPNPYSQSAYKSSPYSYRSPAYSPPAYSPPAPEPVRRWEPPVKQPISAPPPVVQSEPYQARDYSQNSTGSRYASAAVQAAGSSRIVQKNVKKIKRVLNNILDHF